MYYAFYTSLALIENHLAFFFAMLCRNEIEYFYVICNLSTKFKNRPENIRQQNENELKSNNKNKFVWKKDDVNIYIFWYQV